MTIMKAFIYTPENAYAQNCRSCPAIDKCRGTRAFYSCSTWRNNVRYKFKKRLYHVEIRIQPEKSQISELFIPEKSRI